MSKYYFTLLFVFLGQSLFSQKVDDALASEATQLRKLFKEADVAALKANSVYNFSINKSNGTLIARELESEQYIALRSNAKFIRKNFYNDNLTIESYSVKSEKEKNLQHNKFCGHYQQGDVFYSDAQVCAYHLNMDVPGRSVIFESNILYNDPRYLVHLFFHMEVPVKKRTITLNIPDWADIELIEVNFDDYKINKREKKENGIVSYIYELEDIKVISENDNLPGYLHFLPHITVLIKSYNSNGKKIDMLSSTDDLYKWYASLTAKINNKPETLKPKVIELTKGLTNDEDKIKTIFYWVQDNIKYIAFEDGLAAFKPEDAHEVFYKRYGDCKGMANLMKNMLTIAGFDARLTWIGTNKIPYNHEIPSLGVDNHMICTVIKGEDYYILDGTEKYSPFGEYAERIQGKEILVENGNTYILKKVPNEPLSNYLQESVWKFKVEGTDLIGNGKTRASGEYKKVFLNIVNEIKEEDRTKFLRHLVAGSANPDDFKIEGDTKFDRDEAFEITYAMNLKNQSYSYDNELYLDLDFKDDYKGTIIEKERDVPYSFNSKVYKKVEAELTIPDKYLLQHVPEPFSFSNDYFTFNARYKQEGNRVIYLKEIKVYKNILPVSEFANWNEAVEGINRFYNDQLILKAK